MSGFTDRENHLFDILDTFSEDDLGFIVIGGYAVSAFRHRFSVDVDLVVLGDHLGRFAELMREAGFEKIEDRTLQRGRFVTYQKDVALPVTVDLMVDAVQSRETDAIWDYDELAASAEVREIEGSERAITVRIPQKELLVAMKLHGGRLTDARDVVALADEVDFDVVADALDRGDRKRLRAVLEHARDVITRENFADAFKGVFATQKLPEARIAAVETFLDEQIETLSSST